MIAHLTLVLFSDIRTEQTHGVQSFGTCVFRTCLTIFLRSTLNTVFFATTCFREFQSVVASSSDHDGCWRDETLGLFHCAEVIGRECSILVRSNTGRCPPLNIFCWTMRPEVRCVT